jgi:hypothetical protein
MTDTITIHGNDFEYEVLDETHIKFRLAGELRWGIPQHIGQVDDATLRELQKRGMVEDGQFNLSSKRDRIALAAVNKQLAARGMCECSDPGCPGHKGSRHCGKAALTTVYRSDMDDETGTDMCHVCAEDALDSGVFTEN